MYKILTIGLLMMFPACASKIYTQDLLADGKTWHVKSNFVTCPIDDRNDCLNQLEKSMSRHAEELCGGPAYRLFSCSSKDKQWFSQASIMKTCYLKCQNPSQGPDSGAPDSN